MQQFIRRYCSPLLVFFYFSLATLVSGERLTFVKYADLNFFPRTQWPQPSSTFHISHIACKGNCNFNVSITWLMTKKKKQETLFDWKNDGGGAERK